MSAPASRDVRPIPLRAALPTWIRVAALSFGGPAGQIAVMHRLVVEERGWVPEERFLHAMSFCMLLPGPEAQQLATYLGWLLHGRRGGLLAGSLFIVPGFLSILLLSVLYAEFQNTALVTGIFYGLKPAVMAVVVAALLRIGRKTLLNRRRKLVAAAAFVAIFFFGVPFPWIVIGAALVGFAEPATGRWHPGVRTARPALGDTVTTGLFWLAVWLVPIALLALAGTRDNTLLTESLFFSKVAAVTFGGAYAVLSYVAQQAVSVYHWLAPGEMLDGLGMAETTPGPLIQVVQFVGFMGAYRHPGPFSPLVAGTLGSLVTAWVTFVPCFLFVLVGAPWAEHLRSQPRLHASLATITAAVVGVVLNLAVWFSLHTLFEQVSTMRLGPLSLLVPAGASLDVPSAVMAGAAMVAMLRFRVGMIQTLGAAAACGLAWHLLVVTG